MSKVKTVITEKFMCESFKDASFLYTQNMRNRQMFLIYIMFVYLFQNFQHVLQL